MWKLKTDKKIIKKLIGLNSLFQKTPIITPKKQTVQPGDTFKDTVFKPEFENVRRMNHSLE